MGLTPTEDAWLGARDDVKAIELLREAVSTPSVTGHEAAYARAVSERLSTIVDRIELDEFGEDRANLWARWGGTAETGRRGLLFAGHLDTVHARGWEQHWAGNSRHSPFGAAIVDRAVWGRGAGDLKAGISAVIAALDLISRAGYRPHAPVTVLLVADEESGEEGTGTSEGMRRSLDRADAGAIELAADLAVYVEPTTMQIYTRHMGFFIAEVSLTGRAAYFGTPELGIDALRAATEVLQALSDYDAQLRAHPPTSLIGTPFILATGIDAGGSVAVPGDARISLIRKLVPGEDLDTARQELDRVIARAIGDERIVVAVDYPAGRDHPVGGTALVSDASLPPIRSLQSVITRHLPGRGEIAAAPYWSEGPFIANRFDIPVVYCAPGDIANCHTFDEHVDVAEYLAAVEIYAEFIAEYCGLTGVRG